MNYRNFIKHKYTYILHLTTTLNNFKYIKFFTSIYCLEYLGLQKYISLNTLT